LEEGQSMTATLRIWEPVSYYLCQSYTPADKSTATILADPQPSESPAQLASLRLPITPPPS
jgi:hypothetical protein